MVNVSLTDETCRFVRPFFVIFFYRVRTGCITYEEKKMRYSSQRKSPTSSTLYFTISVLLIPRETEGGLTLQKKKETSHTTDRICELGVGEETKDN